MAPAEEEEQWGSGDNEAPDAKKMGSWLQRDGGKRGRPQVPVQVLFHCTPRGDVPYLERSEGCGYIYLGGRTQTKPSAVMDDVQMQCGGEGPDLESDTLKMAGATMKNCLPSSQDGGKFRAFLHVSRWQQRLTRIMTDVFGLWTKSLGGIDE